VSIARDRKQGLGNRRESHKGDVFEYGGRGLRKLNFVTLMHRRNRGYQGKKVPAERSGRKVY